MPEAVLVTEKEFAKAEGVFGSQGEFEVHSVCADEGLLAEALLAKSCRAVIVGVDRYAGPLYEALGKAGKEAGAIIARFGVGHGGIDKADRPQGCISIHQLFDGRRQFGRRAKAGRGRHWRLPGR